MITLIHVISRYGDQEIMQYYHTALLELNYKIILYVDTGITFNTTVKIHDMPGWYEHKLFTSYEKEIWIVLHSSKDARKWRHLMPKAFIIVVLTDDISGLAYADVACASSELSLIASKHYNKHCQIIETGLMNYFDLPISMNNTITFAYINSNYRDTIFVLRVLLALSSKLSWKIIIISNYCQILQWLTDRIGMPNIEWRQEKHAINLFKDSDILIVTDSSKLLVLEALMCQRQVIAVDFPEISKIFEKLELMDNLYQATTIDLAKKITKLCIWNNKLYISPQKVWHHYGRPAFITQLDQAFKSIYMNHYVKLQDI